MSLWTDQEKMQLSVWAMEFLEMKAHRNESDVPTVKLVNELVSYFITKMAVEAPVSARGCGCEHG